MSTLLLTLAVGVAVAVLIVLAVRSARREAARQEQVRANLEHRRQADAAALAAGEMYAEARMERFQRALAEGARVGRRKAAQRRAAQRRMLLRP